MPWLITLVVLSALLVASVVGLERYAYTPNFFIQPYFVEPPLEEGDLRAIAAGKQPAPPDLIDRLLRLERPWLVTPPGADELYVSSLSARGTVSSWVSVGRPLPWFYLSHRRRFSDVFRETTPGHHDALFASMAQRAHPAPAWRLSRGTLFYSDFHRHVSIGLPLLAFSALIIAMTALAAAFVQRQVLRHRRDRSRPPRIRHWWLIAALLATNALALWTVLDVDAGKSRGASGIPVTGPHAPQRTSLTPTILRELRGDPAGGATAARAIVEALPPPAEGRRWSFQGRQLLGATFRHQTQPRIAGWRCGWPLMLVDLREVQRDLPVEGKLQPVIWPPRPAHWRWSGTILSIAFGSETPGNRVRTLTADFTGFTLLLVVLLMTFWACRGCALLAMHRMRRGRARTGKCLACGYRLAALSPS